MTRVKFVCEDRLSLEAALDEIREYPSDESSSVALVSSEGMMVVADFDGPLMALALLDVTINFAGEMFLLEGEEWRALL